MPDPAPALIYMPVAQIVTFWRPGSYDWTWVDEYDNVMQHPQTPMIRRRMFAEGAGFIDHAAPVMLGSDGRVWDGHHRICLAIQLGIPSLAVEVVVNEGAAVA